MKFAVKPYEMPKEYEDFQYHDTPIFYIQLTRRNWIGSGYSCQSEAEWFLEGILDVCEDSFELIPYKPLRKSSFLIDMSSFMIQHEPNSKVDEFLEKLSTGIDPEGLNPKKILSKVRYFATKPENFGTLYRWSLQNPSHILSDEIIKEVEMSFEKIHESFFKKIIKYMSSKASEGKRPEEIAEDKYSKDEERIMTKIMKYSFVDPELFIFNAVWASKWYDHYEKMNWNNATYVTCLDGRKNQCHAEIFQGFEFHKECLFNQEMYGDFLKVINRTELGKTTSLMSLKLSNREINIHDEVLKSISNWVVKQIEKKRAYELPKNRWYADVEWDVLRDIGILETTIMKDTFLDGKNGEKELLVYAKCKLEREYVADDLEADHFVVYPLVSPNEWDDERAPLSKLQKLIQTYTLCLYHDIVVGNEFHFEDTDEDVVYSDFVERMMPEKHKKLQLQGRRLSKKSNSRINRNNGESHSSEYKVERAEHWVAFHFRKLKSGQLSSDIADKNARKYDIEIPHGFTFVDAYFKGGKVEQEKQLKNKKVDVKFSALEIFKKALERAELESKKEEIFEEEQYSI